jgi:hypothetical protein
LQVLGYRVVASSSTAVKQEYHEFIWTMRKEFSDPEPFISGTSATVDNLANLGREANNHALSKLDFPE